VSRPVPLEGLQRYQIMEILGSGSQGHTYRAIDRETHAEVAVKVLSLKGASEWKAFELFEREVAVLAGLRHPGIPRYRDYFTSEESGDYFLVMDLVEGESLAAEMTRPGRFNEAKLRELMVALLDILDYLHGLTPPVIHRDLKPANIIIDVRGRVHLVDFGGVRVATRIGGGSTMIGTFGYMAPEQLHGDAGPAVDLYALGATIVALATGRSADELPHEGLAIDLDQLELPASLRPILARLLEPDPRDRARTVAEVRGLLTGQRSARDSEGARGRPRPHPRPEPAATGQTAALAVPEFVQEIAEIRKPMSIAVWLLALMGAGALLVIEYAILPLVYLVMAAVANHKRRKGEVVDDAAGVTTIHQLRRTAARQRELAGYVIRETSPLRDETPALPPGKDD